MLDPVLLSSIGDLELVARVVIDGTLSGLHQSPFHGYSAEFSQYRHYRAGDDLKYIDWKLFARTDRFYTKQYRETTDMVAEIAIDASASMAFRGRTGVTKIAYARLLAAALAHLISRQGDAVGLVVYADGLRHYVPSRAGPSHLRRLLVALTKLEASGGISAAGAAGAAGSLARAIDLLRRRGLLVIVSDLYDEDEAVERELKRAARIGHEVALFHVLSRDEIEFPYASRHGHIELEDLETGRTVLASPRSIGPSYRRDVAEFLERWRARAAAYGIDYTRAISDMPLDATLRGYLLKRRASGACPERRRGPR
jgi:uncharacterized protein (DUF58 family)